MNTKQKVATAVLLAGVISIADVLYDTIKIDAQIKKLPLTNLELTITSQINKLSDDANDRKTLPATPQTQPIVAQYLASKAEYVKTLQNRLEEIKASPDYAPQHKAYEQNTKSLFKDLWQLMLSIIVIAGSGTYLKNSQGE